MEGVGHCIMLYNPMSHGAHTLLYNPMTHGAHALLYNPMTHGDLYPLYNVVWPHDPWGFVTIAAPMTHREKVAEGALECTCRLVCRLGWISMDPNGFVVQLGSIESENKSILVNST